AVRHEELAEFASDVCLTLCLGISRPTLIGEFKSSGECSRLGAQLGVFRNGTLISRLSLLYDSRQPRLFSSCRVNRVPSRPSTGAHDRRKARSNGLDLFLCCL